MTSLTRTPRRSWQQRVRQIPSLTGVTLYRFLDAMGDVVDERQFADHAAALTWAAEGVAEDNEIQRVEFLGPEGDWRWAGPLLG